MLQLRTEGSVVNPIYPAPLQIRFDEVNTSVKIKIFNQTKSTNIVEYERNQWKKTSLHSSGDL